MGNQRGEEFNHAYTDSLFVCVIQNQTCGNGCQVVLHDTFIRPDVLLEWAVYTASVLYCTALYSTISEST